MKELPIPPTALWTGSRDALAIYDRDRDHIESYPEKKEVTPTSIRIHSENRAQPKMGPTVNTITIPPIIWNAALLPPSKTEYAEGAIVHAQLLSRNQASDDVPSPSDMAMTIQSVRLRLWSIPLSKEARKKAYDLICEILERIPDPLARAAAMVNVFYGKLDNRMYNIGPPKDLGRLPWTVAAIARALTHTVYVSDPSVSFSRILSHMQRKVTLEFMESLGVDSNAMRHALSVDRGFDLITVAATIRWIREVQQDGPDFWMPPQSNWPYPHNILDRVAGIYGWAEIGDPVHRKTNEQYLTTAINRLTQYKKGLQKRQKK